MVLPYTLEFDEKALTVKQNRGNHNCDRTPEIQAFENEWLDYVKKVKEQEEIEKEIIYQEQSQPSVRDIDIITSEILNIKAYAQNTALSSGKYLKTSLLLTNDMICDILYVTRRRSFSTSVESDAAA